MRLYGSEPQNPIYSIETNCFSAKYIPVFCSVPDDWWYYSLWGILQLYSPVV